jgi:hypothetical protein
MTYEDGVLVLAEDQDAYWWKWYTDSSGLSCLLYFLNSSADPVSTFLKVEECLTAGSPAAIRTVTGLYRVIVNTGQKTNSINYTVNLRATLSIATLPDSFADITAVKMHVNYKLMFSREYI